MRIDDENKVVVPDYVADYIEKAKIDGCSLDDVFSYLSIQGELANEFLEWLFNNDESENEKRFLLVVSAWVEGYTIEQPQKYYWRKKKEHLAWFEDVEQSYICRANFSDDIDYHYFLSELETGPFKLTETEARDILKDDFDKFEKVECEQTEIKKEPLTKIELLNDSNIEIYHTKTEEDYEAFRKYIKEKGLKYMGSETVRLEFDDSCNTKYFGIFKHAVSCDLDWFEEYFPDSPIQEFKAND